MRSEDCEGGPERLDDEGAPLPAVALEPEDLPDRPLTVDKVEPLIAKEIGLPVIRAHVHHNYALGGFGIAVSVVMHPPEGSLDVRPRVLRLAGGNLSSWDEMPADGALTEPTLTLDDDSAHALLDALTRHYQGAEDTRALRRDYDAERKRVDLLIGHLASVTGALAGEGDC